MKFHAINTKNIDSLLKYIKENREYEITITQVKQKKKLKRNGKRSNT